MGLFSKNYNKNRVSVYELKDHVDARGIGVGTCQENGNKAVLIVDSLSVQLTVIYDRELSVTTLSPYDMYYDGSYSQDQIQRILRQNMNNPSIDVIASRVGKAFTFGVSINMNHRYFSLDEFDKNLGRLNDALEAATRILSREGILG